MTSPRVHRVAEQIQVELADIIHRRLKDPRRGFITLTGVDLTPDLKLAKVYVSALEAEDLEQGLATLKRAKGFLRHELGQRIRLRYLPDLQFFADQSVEYGNRVEELLRGLHERGELDEEEPES
jgi:ribosome-binding factor A